MITIHESHLILIIILTALITYIIHSYYLDCNVDCKINYYKYENYHDKKKDPEPQNIHQVMTKKSDHDRSIEINPVVNLLNSIDEKTFSNDDYDLPFKKETSSYNIGDRTSSQNASIQSTNIDGDRYDDEYINKLYRSLY